MIKKDGVAIMNVYTANSKIAKENLFICKDKKYSYYTGKLDQPVEALIKEIDISADLDYCVKQTVLYKSDDVLSETISLSLSSTVELTNETATQAAIRLKNNSKHNIVILNFANGCNLGGGYLAGSFAQEEDLCRKSALYSCLKNKPMFYNENIMIDNHYFTDNILYSPNVPFFRDEDNKLIEQPYHLSIISAPAPNLSVHQNDDDKDYLFEVIKKRAIRILQIAAINNHKNIILGAWGCGAFKNDPIMIATAFKLALDKVPAFEHVCFAISSRNEENVNLNSFKKVFDGK